VGTREHPPPTDEEPYRDVADLSWLTNGLRRLKLLGPPKAPPAEQLALFGPPKPLKPAAGPDGGDEPTNAPIAKDWRARIVLGLAVVGYVALFTRWTFQNQDALGTQAFDLGIFDQGVWLLSQFREPFVTINGRNLFGDHTSLILLPFAAVYWVLPTAKTLLFAQAAALGAGAIPTFLLARRLLRNELLAAGLGLAYLLQPVLSWTNMEHFHPDVFEVPLVLFAFWFVVERRWLGYFVCVGLLLLVKEDVGLLTLGLGAYVAWKHDRRIGLITCAASVAWLAAAFWVIIPAFNPGGTVYTGRIPFGGPSGFLRKAVSEPGEVLDYLLIKERAWYVWQLFAPLGLVAVVAAPVLVALAGPLALNLISSFPYQYDIRYHYSTLILPVLVAATVFAVSSDRLRSRRGASVGIVLAASVFGAHLWGATPLGRDEPFVAARGSETVASFRRAQQLLPDGAIVSAYYGWVPQISHRPEIYMFPNPFKASYWGAFKQEGQRLPQADRVQYLLLPTQLDREPKEVLDGIRAQFETVYEEDGVLLMRRPVG